MLTDGQTDGRTEWGIAIALSQIGWLGAKNHLNQTYLNILLAIYSIYLNEIEQKKWEGE